MDKRSILFVVALSLAFFGIQAWFGTPAPVAPQQKKPVEVVQAPKIQEEPLLARGDCPESS